VLRRTRLRESEGDLALELAVGIAKELESRDVVLGLDLSLLCDDAVAPVEAEGLGL
jgi:hypothetical protein